MPLYDFQSDAGDIIEMAFSMREVPESIEQDGRIYRKIITSLPQLSGLDTARNRGEKYPYVSNRLPPTIDGCKTVRTRRKDGTMGRPKPLIESRKHEREVMARNDLVREDD